MGSSDLMSLRELQAGCVWRKQRPIGEERTVFGSFYDTRGSSRIWHVLVDSGLVATNNVFGDLHDEELPPITCVLS